MTDQGDVILKVEKLKKYFPIRRGVFRRVVGQVKAVDDVSFQVYRGETLGLVGESGCGKTTIGRTISRLYDATEGRILFNDTDLTQLKGPSLRLMRRNIQMVFQDPYASLNPRMNIYQIISEPLIIFNTVPRANRKERVAELMQLVGLNPSVMGRFPHEFSGGQRQRIGLARSLALNPDLIVCDEPISALDVSIQAQVVNLLEELQEKLNLTYIFIAHDLSMVRHISKRVAVMYLGKIMELTDNVSLYECPLHPYTQALLSAIPVPDPVIEEKRQRIILEGDLPSPAHPPVGCNFNTRCHKVQDICHKVDPEFKEVRPGHFVACHLVNGNSSEEG
ncbi:MAG: dipeptide ABC transporter ATP-binding protein [Chloroflexi bacterium]|nr:MAG: dipeptide ABC transporter ATP-binding protein [Chloroflexota bacterium]